ncbi:MAG: class I SAM-dependent methyltransferase [Planctomycetota bacterium]|jgi:SAM-dependent methyltransferase
MGVSTMGFRKERLERLGELEGWHFWFQGRNKLIWHLLEKYSKGTHQTTLDLGCATGSMLKQMSRWSRHVVGIDLHITGLQGMRDSLPSASTVQGDVTVLPFKEDTFDVVTLMDVLEHVDDRLVLSETRRVLRPGGIGLITVPAFSWLWSYRDIAASHRRRYNRRQIKNLLGEFHFKVLEVRYYQCLLFPLLFISRWFGHEKPMMRDLEETPSPFVNRVLLQINKLEVILGRCISWPWGSSLVIVCETD